MKLKKGQEAPVTGALLKDLMDRDKVQQKSISNQTASIDSQPLQQPDLYQDPGGGYNHNFVFPQD